MNAFYGANEKEKSESKQAIAVEAECFTWRAGSHWKWRRSFAPHTSSPPAAVLTLVAYKRSACVTTAPCPLEERAQLAPRVVRENRQPAPEATRASSG